MYCCKVAVVRCCWGLSVAWASGPGGSVAFIYTTWLHYNICYYCWRNVWPETVNTGVYPPPIALHGISCCSSVPTFVRVCAQVLIWRDLAFTVQCISGKNTLMVGRCFWCTVSSKAPRTMHCMYSCMQACKTRLCERHEQNMRAKEGCYFVESCNRCALMTVPSGHSYNLLECNACSLFKNCAWYFFLSYAVGPFYAPLHFKVW